MLVSSNHTNSPLTFPIKTGHKLCGVALCTMKTPMNSPGKSHQPPFPAWFHGSENLRLRQAQRNQHVSYDITIFIHFYPLVNVYITMERSTKFFMSKSTISIYIYIFLWPFSIAILTISRGYIPEKSPKKTAPIAKISNVPLVSMDSKDAKVPRGEFLHQVVPFGLAHLVLGTPMAFVGNFHHFLGGIIG